MAGAFPLGLSKYMQADLAGAIGTWSDLLARDPQPKVESQTLYWIGKALAASGDDSAAKEKYAAAAAVRPVDYYVMRAQVALNPPPSSANFDPASIGAADESQLA